MKAAEVLDRDWANAQARRQATSIPAVTAGMEPDLENQPPEALKAALDGWQLMERQRIAAGEEPDPSGLFEQYAVQRRWFATQRQLAAQRVDRSGGYFPNPRDRESQIEMHYLNYASVGYSTSNMPFEGVNIQSMDELVAFAHEAQDGNTSRDKLIDRLRDQILDLQQDLFLEKGKKK
jgi:hypothetical protein